jgi:hypothetical protein
LPEDIEFILQRIKWVAILGLCAFKLCCRNQAILRRLGGFQLSPYLSQITQFLSEVLRIQGCHGPAEQAEELQMSVVRFLDEQPHSEQQSDQALIAAQRQAAAADECSCPDRCKSRPKKNCPCLSSTCGRSSNEARPSTSHRSRREQDTVIQIWPTRKQGSSGEAREPSERRSQRPRESSERRSQGPREPSERRSQRPREPSERRSQGPREPSERRSQRPREPSERRSQGPREPSERRSQRPREPSERHSQRPREPSERRSQRPREPSEPRRPDRAARQQMSFQEGLESLFS